MDDRAATVLAVKDLVKHYSKVAALDGLSLSVGKGEVYGFLGRNGAGKSTAIRIITGISKQNRGQVELFENRLSPLNPKARQQIGYVAQEQNFYSWMTPERIGNFVGGFYPEWNSNEYQRLCKNLDLPATRKIQGFSGGMKAKLALALALAHRPPLLVLDEPMAGLDPVARREFIQLVRNQAESSGRTTFFSSHLVDEVEAAADRIGIIEQGKMQFEGSLDRLLSSISRLYSTIDENEPPDIPMVFTAGNGFRILHDRILGPHQSGPRRRELIIWAERPSELTAALQQITSSNWTVEPMNLEDIFVELVSRKTL